MELAANLKGHLLLVAGDQDANVHPAHLMRFADALIKAGKNFDMVLLPGAKHGYTGANERFYEKKLWNHFARYLLNDFDIGLFSGDVLGYKGRPYSAAGGVAGRFPFDGKIAWR